MHIIYIIIKSYQLQNLARGPRPAESTSISLYLSEFSTIFSYVLVIVLVSLPEVIQGTTTTRDMMVSRSIKKVLKFFRKLAVKMKIHY